MYRVMCITCFVKYLVDIKFSGKRFLPSYQPLYERYCAALENVKISQNLKLLASSLAVLFTFATQMRGNLFFVAEHLKLDLHFYKVFEN